MIPKRIGEFLVERGLLTEADVGQILEYGKRNHRRFGEAAIELGLLTEQQLTHVFGENYRVNFFHLDPKSFPQLNSKLVGVDAMIRHGVLPLGFKQGGYSLFGAVRTLNLGMLDPGNREGQKVAEEEVRKNGETFKRTQVFLILADQFLDVLSAGFGVKAGDILLRAPENVDRTLALSLDDNVP
jgi:hypothetical protein